MDAVQIAPGVGGERLLPLQQVQIALDGGKGGAQVVGDVGNGVFQLHVPLLEFLPGLPQLLQLEVQLRRQFSGVGVPGGEENGAVGVLGQPLPQLLDNLVQAAPEQPELDQQDQHSQRQSAADQPGEHVVTSFSVGGGLRPAPPYRL